MLSHYDAVIWYTGDDVVTRPVGQGAGNADRLAMDEILEFRAYMNEGGRVVYTGAWAGQQFVRAGAVGQQFYDPKGVGPCNPRPAGFDPRRCLALAGSPNSDGINDVLEYWFGAYALAAGDGHDPETGEHFGVNGIDDPFGGLSWAFGPGRRGQPEHERVVRVHQRHPGAVGVPAVQQLAVEPVRQAGRAVRAAYRRPVRVLADRGRHLQAADPRDRGAGRWRRVLTFWTSYDTEPAWDHLFVEARTAGGNDWTTLPDANGHTTTAPGDSCAAGWRDLHPRLDHYQTFNRAAGTCTATGTHRRVERRLRQLRRLGSSGGSTSTAYAGKTVEISIAYATDWAVQNLGVFIDDVTLPGRHEHVVRDRVRRLAGHRAAGRQRAEREQLDPHRRGRVPRRRQRSAPRTRS